MLSPGAVFLLLLIIGIAAGLLFDRVAGAGWLSRQIAGPNRLLVTSARWSASRDRSWAITSRCSSASPAMARSSSP